MMRVGRLTFKEGVLRPFEETWDSDGRKVSLNGLLVSDPAYPMARLAEMHDDVLGLPASLVPVTFDDKSHRNGYYVVRAAKSSIVQLGYQALNTLAWEIDLTRVGADSEVDIESRFAGPINRLNDFSVAGERYHAPAGGHTAYWAASDTPGITTRTGEDGPIKVYRSLSLSTNPRWACPISGYGLGRVRLISLGERFGEQMKLPAAWSLENSLVRVQPSGSSLAVFSHSGVVWSSAKLWNITAGGTPLGAPLMTSVLHNEYERVTIRLLWNVSPNGRIMADLTLRRGSRILEILVRANVSTTLGVVRASNEAGTSGSGFVRGTSNDVDGHRYIVGSSKTFTGDLTAGGISKASVTRLDAFVGVEVGGSSAVTGDQAANLLAQYVGGPAETVMAVKR